METCRNWSLFCFFCLPPPTLFLYCGISYANDGANSCIVVECFEREWNGLYIKTLFFLQNKTKCLMRVRVCLCVCALCSSWQRQFCGFALGAGNCSNMKLRTPILHSKDCLFGKYLALLHPALMKMINGNREGMVLFCYQNFKGSVW